MVSGFVGSGFLGLYFLGFVTPGILFLSGSLCRGLEFVNLIWVGIIRILDTLMEFLILDMVCSSFGFPYGFVFAGFCGWVRRNIGGLRLGVVW